MCVCVCVCSSELALDLNRISVQAEMEKEMATHSSVLAWRIPWTEEPGRPWVHAVAESQT